MSLRLSVLDQSPVSEGASRATALTSTVRLAAALDHRGYSRFWVAEHHDSPGFAGSAPEVLVASILEHTERLRVGSGGVLLPRYRAGKVAEVFSVLAALHPGRVDLGIGRAGGPAAAFPDQVAELQQRLGLASDHAAEDAPALWMLGTSGSSAELAASAGAGFAFGHFLNPGPGIEAITRYREAFVPAQRRTQSEAALAVRVVVAATAEAAQELAASVLLWRSRKDRGQDLPFPSVQTTNKHAWSAHELARLAANRENLVHGTPDSVRGELELLAKEHNVTEIIVNTPLGNYADRLLSYELLADAFLH
jgi:luciferase family oxidoreductase group 1